MLYSILLLPARLLLYILSTLIMGISQSKKLKFNGERTPVKVTSQTHSQNPVSPPEPQKPSEFEQERARIEAKLSQLNGLLKAMKAPLPTGTGDGSPSPEEQKSLEATFKEILIDVKHLGFDSIEKIGEMGLTLGAGEDVDDRKYLMEYLVKVGTNSDKIHIVADSPSVCGKAAAKPCFGHQDHKHFYHSAVE